jgi:hypothetical protein
LAKELESIVSLLKEKSFSKAISAIEEFNNKHQKLTLYIDPVIDALILEFRSLESEIKQLFDEKADVEKIIHEFNIRHNKNQEICS